MFTSVKLIAWAITLFALVNNADAFWRLQCFGRLGTAMIDPIVSPGSASTHEHTVKGGSAFSESSTADDLLKSKCTSCQVDQDRSAYWTPTLWFHGSDGKFTRVPETTGHIVYYKYTVLYVGGKLTPPVAAPNGLKIISGDTNLRNFTLPIPDPPMPWTGADVDQHALAQKALGFNCLNYKTTPEPSLYRHFMPSKSYIDANCPDGLRLELLFPQCWNGKDLDTPDHKSHMRFPNSGINGGSCPEGFDVPISQIFYETYYDPSPFKSQDGEFVLSNGDPTGFGFHGDLLIAWQPNVLQKAIDVCGPDSSPSDIGASGVTSNCPVFEMVSESEQKSCRMENSPSLRKKDSQDKLDKVDKLPGNNPIQRGPAPASKAANGGAPATDAPSTAPIPTLSYTAGSSGLLPAGGNILMKGAATNAPSPSPSPSSTSLPAPAPPASTPSPPPAPAAPAAPAPPPAAPPAPAAPALTPAPAPAAPKVDTPPNVAFSTISSAITTIGAVAYENVLIEEIVTVYVTEPKVKREGHLRRHQVHGRHHQHHARGSA